MTIFELIKPKDIDELAEWFDDYCNSDYAPWWKYWDDNYCNKCEPENVYVPEFGRECDCAWCELNGNKCKFFKEMDEIPDNKQIIKMWLESECQ